MSYLNFSDSAKYAEVGKNLAEGVGFVVHHNFFSRALINNFVPDEPFLARFSPLNSWILSLVFRIFPATDQVVALTGYLFLIATAVLLFYLGKRIHSLTAGLIAAILLLADPYLLEYAHNFTTEITFIFLVVLAGFLILTRYRLFVVVPLVLAYLTRPHWPFLALAISAALVFNYKGSLIKIYKKRRGLVLSAIAISLLLAGLGFSSVRFQHSTAYLMRAGEAQGQYLRGQPLPTGGISSLGSKVFYNLYNYLKAPERLISPILIFIFVLGLFIVPNSKNKQLNTFYVFAVSFTTLLLLAAAATLPNARYVHPANPLVILLAAITLMEITSRLKPLWQKLALIATVGLIILPTIGHYTLDARFRRQTFNVDRPPITRQIPAEMAKHIPQGRLIITNLDAWAAWYEGLTTMWFPLAPELLAEGVMKVDYIVITNYLEHDADFALGPWSEIVYSPENIENELIKENFDLLTTFTITPDQVYEKQEIIGTILINKRLGK